MFKYKDSLNRGYDTCLKPYRHVKSKIQILHAYMSGDNPEKENKYFLLRYWFGEIIGYGLLINIPLWMLFGRHINPLTILSYGIVWWLVKVFRQGYKVMEL